jgi:hypothetical protein
MEVMPMAYHFVGRDSVEVLMYPPQSPPPPRFHVIGNRIEVPHEGRTTAYTYAIRGDSLTMQSEGMAIGYSRVGRSARSAGLLGSWRHRDRQLTFVITFRPDSAFVTEVGLPALLRLTGDTIEMVQQSLRQRIVIHRRGENLVLEYLDTPRAARRNGPSTVVLIRRPWGCFGVPALDGGGCR